MHCTILNNYCNKYVKTKVKVTPLQAMKAMGDVDAMVHIYIGTALGRGRVACPMLCHFY